MFDIDICCCTYNSSKWFKSFFEALCNVDYDKKKLHFYFTDNASIDDTVSELEKFKEEIGGQFGDFEIIQSGYNAGFGAASNMSARAGKSEIVFFYNVDTEIEPDAFGVLSREIQNSDVNIGAFEMRQLPHEIPKYYNPVTLETSWAAAAALALRREVFEKTGGFDESIFMYGEDVDLSWRIRLAGYTIKYLPHATTYHYLKTPGEIKATEVAGQLAGDKILRLKYGTDNDVLLWRDTLRYTKPLLDGNPFIADMAEKMLAAVDKNKNRYRRFYKTAVKNSDFEPDFQSGYEFVRAGYAYTIRKPEKVPGITVIVRTFNRADVLELTLQSLCNQTVKDFRVIVCEDGQYPVSEQTVEKFSKQLNIEYLPLMRKAGRCVAGNTALENVKTDYAVFLDDDDYFFADYIETIAVLINENPNCKMFCSSSIEARTTKDNEIESEYSFVNKKHLPAVNLRRANFYAFNPTPIQAVVFHMDLYREYGGFDVELDAFEDWDLWMRYATYCEIACVDKSLSIFKVPSGYIAYSKRTQQMNRYRKVVFEKSRSYCSEFTAQDIISLSWTPKTIKDDSKEDFIQLNETAVRIENSKSYRISLPFIKLFNGLSRFFSRVADYFGPEKLSGTAETYEQIQNFVVSAQDAPFIRNLTKLFNSIKR